MTASNISSRAPAALGSGICFIVFFWLAIATVLVSPNICLPPAEHPMGDGFRFARELMRVTAPYVLSTKLGLEDRAYSEPSSRTLTKSRISRCVCWGGVVRAEQDATFDDERKE